MTVTDVQNVQGDSAFTRLLFTKTAVDASVGDETIMSDIRGDYQPFQVEAGASTTATVEIYARLAVAAGWVLVDTIVLTAGQSVLKTYFEFPRWGFKVTAYSGANGVKVWSRQDAV